MKKTYLALFCFFFIFNCFSQTDQRIPITSITPSLNTGQDYSPWLNDNTDDLVADAYGDNSQYIDVTLHLNSPSLISKLSFWDDQGIFTSSPAYIYALSGNQKFYLGKFEGLAYKTYVDLILQYPMLADAIIVHKYGNSIPQKVQVYGQPYIAGTTPLPETRLYFASATPSENTGQDFTLWFNDNLDSSVQWGFGDKYSDVTLKLQKKSRISRLSFYDAESIFTSNPAYFYAITDTGKAFLGLFEGLSYLAWVDLRLPEYISTDTIFVHKFGGYIPKKVQAYGIPLLDDPLDTLVPSDGRIKIIDVTPSENTGQDYSSWLTDNLDSLVPNVYTEANEKYTDITLTLQSESKIGRLSFYDYEGVFSTNPAYIYAKRDTTLTLLGTFTGPSYKTYEDLLIPDSVIADAIVVHKWGNNIPEKIKAFGAPYIYIPVDTSKPVQPTIQDTTPIVRIPIDANRWYELDYDVADVTHKMFDGDSVTNIYGGYNRVVANYDAYYPVGKDEHIDLQAVKFFDGEGISMDNPLTLSVINDQDQKIQVGTFTGSQYNTWVGSYPDRQNNAINFTLDSVIKNVKYIVLNSWYIYPSEIQLFGKYKAGTVDSSAPIAKTVRFRDATGVNIFEWNLESPYSPTNIDSSSYAAVKSFGGVRHYMDWDKLEHDSGSYTYNPTNSGGWNYDTIYQRCKADSITVLACLKTIPGWMQATYPSDEQDGENIPVPYGSDFSDPMSYIKQAKVAFQYIARYGNNQNVTPSLLSINSNPRWTNDPVNVLKIGMGVIKYIECDNERDKWWKGRKGYQTSYEYAANLSAFYDGNMNTMGPGVGVKNADSTVKVVMGGLASPDPSYVRGMIEWCKLHRGYKADGTINLCWDVINYHLYCNNDNTAPDYNSTRGIAPEKSRAAAVATSFRTMAHQYAMDMPVWITELGFDVNQGSPFKAIAIGNKSALQTQADWNLRSALLYARAGIEKTFFYELYDDNILNPSQFSSMGFINTDAVHSRKPSADYFMQVNKLIGDYTYVATLNSDPFVDEYTLNGKKAFALTIPDEVGRTGTYELDLENTDSVKICTPLAGSDTMLVQYAQTNNGKLTVAVTETPIFVLPLTINKLASSTNQKISNTTEESKFLDPIQQLLAEKLKVYPNPSSGVITITLAGDVNNTTEISLISTSTGKVLLISNAPSSNGTITKQINLDNLPAGMYTIAAKQGGKTQYRKIVKLSN